MIKISETLLLAGGNLARPTRFTAMIAPPTEISVSSDSKMFDVLCKSIKVPDISMETMDMKFKGHTIKIPGRVQQEQTIELTMYLDENHRLRQVFNDWINGMDNRNPAINSIGSSNLQNALYPFGNLIIKARTFDETNAEPMNYFIEGVYPISVSGPEFGSAAVAEVSEFTVTLAYYRFLSGDSTGVFDDVDAFLDTFGISPKAYGLFSNLGQFNTLLSQTSSAIGATTSAFSAVSSIF